MKSLLHTLLAVSLIGAVAGPAAAQEDPYAEPAGTWISISGTVESVGADQFVLEYEDTDHYGEALITVEMDDGDRDADAYKLVPGDTVTVNGIIDDDFFELRTIEASSVHVENLDTWFYASAVDEEDTFITVPVVTAVPSATVQGTVTSVGDEEFTVDSGVREITVEVDELGYNPLDEMGYQQIEIGDLVTVTGYLDDDFLEGRELVATSVTTIERTP